MDQPLPQIVVARIAGAVPAVGVAPREKGQAVLLVGIMISGKLTLVLESCQGWVRSQSSERLA